jgi:chromosome segregation ATPase
MMISSYFLRQCAYLMASALLLGMVQNGHARLYRWENEQGKVIYSDQVPPEEAKFKKEALSKSAKVTAVIEGAKSKEQWELEKRLEGLRKEQEKIIAKQKSDDKVLLTTYHREDDIRSAQKKALLAIDGQQKLAEGNLLRLEQQLKAHQQEAAKLERRGATVPQDIIDKISETKRQLSEARGEVERLVQKKADVSKEFEANIARYNFLTHSDVAVDKLSAESAELKAADELGLVICVSMDQCARLWQKAREYVQKYSTTPIDVDNDKLIMTGDPRSSEDMSLSVSRMERQGRPTQIFLDIRCHKSSLGEELCASSKVKGIRTAFRPYIESDSTPPQ